MSTDLATTAPTAPHRLPPLGHAWQLHRRPLSFLQDQRTPGPVVLGGRLVAYGDLPALDHTGRTLSEVVRWYPLWLVIQRALSDAQVGPVTSRRGSFPSRTG